MTPGSSVRYRRHRRAISAALVAIAQGREPVLPPQTREAPEEFVEAVRYHRLGPLAHVLCRSVAPDVAQLLRPDRDRAIAMHVYATEVVRQFGGLLEDIPWVVFKGPVLSELAHPAHGLRDYQDLDLLVAPADLRIVSQRLLGAGWSVLDYDDMLTDPQVPGEMHWRTPAGLQVDLHWAMINTQRRREHLAVPTEELLRRRVPVHLGFASAWTLAPEDALLHVCMHAALTGANKLLYLVDAQQSAARVNDWPEVARRARAWQVAPHLCLVLQRARRALGGRPPTGLDRMLGLSPAFRAVTGLVDALAPVPHARREPGIARLVARAVQPGAVRTVAASARSVVRYLRHQQPSVPTDRITAGRAALDDYLTRVEAAG